ncbi:MAG TPA: PfkB family carbohydrate kinase [Paracoccaceae bacterium]|nr:PfkB family carbohydrate kinase [Paracoccaceae bacterium]
MPAEVACIGAAHWDIVGRATRPPAAGDELPGRVARCAGGLALDLALGLARAGVRVELITALGRDTEGDILLEIAARAGVMTGRSLRLDAPTGCHVAIEGPDGSLFSAVADSLDTGTAGVRLLEPLARGPCPPLVVADDSLDPAASTRLLTLPVSRLILVPARPARAARLRPALARGRASLILNRAGAEAMLGRPFRDSRIAAAALCAAGAHEAVVTDGRLPASRTGPEGTVTVPPPPGAAGVPPGADAAFAAALIAADLAGHAPDAALARALATFEEGRLNENREPPR